MNIITLVENNSVSENLKCEHGLSFYIETQKNKILFDLGASTLFAENAEKLGINIKNIDTVIISHGHYDHGGGLKTFLQINKTAKIYINKNAFEDYYSLRPNEEMGYIGLDKSLKNNERIIFTENYYKIDKGIELFSNVTKRELFSISNNVLFKKIKENFENDDFIHEQNLVLNENGKAILIAGCAHNGIINIINKYIELKEKAPDILIGGFHLTSPRFNKNEDSKLINEIGNILSKYSTKYYTCHCTGITPYKLLKEKLNDKINYLSTGSRLDVN
jgi:7,8-dihydropterin-6-yl-methyl-4-(beta-D-ribofuranosyl)aminobenzene 5'-phosphate synthase